jgi:rhodanese-related sulfurtransferase
METTMSTNISTITPEQLYYKQLYGHRPALLDVRTHAEYRAGHIPEAKHLPLQTLEPHAVPGHFNKPALGGEETLYLTCQAGPRAQAAAERLQQAGFHNLALVEGGTRAWEDTGLPLVRHGHVISLERQVQIAIGSLLLLKVLLGFSVHELFFALTAVIGAGLVMAGTTRWCGMAELIARLPWNRSRNITNQARA